MPHPPSFRGGAAEPGIQSRSLTGLDSGSAVPASRNDGLKKNLSPPHKLPPIILALLSAANAGLISPSGSEDFSSEAVVAMGSKMSRGRP